MDITASDIEAALKRELRNPPTPVSWWEVETGSRLGGRPRRAGVGLSHGRGGGLRHTVPAAGHGAQHSSRQDASLGVRLLPWRFGGRTGVVSLHDDLLRQARQLAVKEPRRPLQASLRRAVSASYYALFHLLVDDATRLMLAGRDRTALRHCLARAFGHAAMRQVAQQFSNDSVSPKLSPGLDGRALQPELLRVAGASSNFRRPATRRITTWPVGSPVVKFSISGAGGTGVRDWHGVRGSIQADTFLTGLLAFANMRG